MKQLLPAVLLAGQTLLGTAWAQTTSSGNAAGTTAGAQPDDTKVNKSQAVTAQDASNKESDVDITAKIRREIVANDNMSQYAKNVKIVVKNGKVTLNGPVRTPEEKSQIEQIAIKIAGQGKVTSDIEIAPAH